MSSRASPDISDNRGWQLPYRGRRRSRSRMSVQDHHIYTASTVLWRPQEGSSVALDEDDYCPFTHVSRTVHLLDALLICTENAMTPKPILSLSYLNARKLRTDSGNPCKNLRVLTFYAKLDDDDEDSHDIYGNIEFALPIAVMMQRWKNLYLVEMITSRSHTTTRILATNSDFSSVLPLYDPRVQGGAWRLTQEGEHECLLDCRRYQDHGYNRDGHTLEFLIEVSEVGMKKILDEVTISFRNHMLGRSGDPRDCQKFGCHFTCPTPVDRDSAAIKFFSEHHRLNARHQMATPKLSPSARRFRKRFLDSELPSDPDLIRCFASLGVNAKLRNETKEKSGDGYGAPSPQSPQNASPQQAPDRSPTHSTTPPTNHASTPSPSSSSSSSSRDSSSHVSAAEGTAAAHPSQ